MIDEDELNELISDIAQLKKGGAYDDRHALLALIVLELRGIRAGINDIESVMGGVSSELESIGHYGIDREGRR